MSLCDTKGIEGKVRWHLNRWLLKHLGLLRRGTWVTVRDAFGAPGDTLLTAMVCRIITENFPGVRINCITPNPELLEHDPHIAKLNGPDTYISLRHWYLEMVENKKGEENVLAESMRSLGIAEYDYRARVYLTETEKEACFERLRGLSKPLVSINTRSKEPVKNWPAERWQELAGKLRQSFDIVQLGDHTEMEIAGVRSFAGTLGLRESMAVLAHMKAHVGPDSFLMHAANGLGIPSAIIFGGSRTAANAGYSSNIDFYVPMPCGPCYIHETRGERCAHGIECMNRVAVDEVYTAVLQLMEKRCG